MPDPAVSVIVPHYGDHGPTSALVDSLLPQRPHEIIVVDDASPQPFPDTSGVRLLRHERNGGFGSAVNAGARAATGDLLLVLNSDIEVGPTFVADLMAASAPWL